MQQLRTVFFFFGWTIITLAMGALGLLFMPFPRRAIWWFNTQWAGATLWWLRLTCGLEGRVEGTVQGPLIASKHQSTLDTLVLWCTLRNPVFVLKRELYWIPIFGWYLWRSGQIAINRSDGRTAFEQIAQQAPALLAQGRSMIVFPEGTRVRVGDRKPMRSGVARISALLNLPVTPVALNAGLYWPKHRQTKKRGIARIKFLPPVPACTGDQTEWMARLETLILTESDALAAAAE